MDFVIDIGNTRLKWARVERGRLTGHGNATHVNDWRTAAAELAQALPVTVGRVMVANVAGEQAATEVAAVINARRGARIHFARTHAEQLGVRCAYAEPHRLGVDRWVAMLAARRRGTGAVCVVSAGTAITFDALAADGRHLGGLILAGSRIAAAALRDHTRNIGDVDVDRFQRAGAELLGRDTATAVGHGALLALSAGLDRAVVFVAHALKVQPVVLLTGGDAQGLAAWMETPARIEADLVLEGLALLVEQS